MTLARSGVGLPAMGAMSDPPLAPMAATVIGRSLEDVETAAQVLRHLDNQ